MRELAKARGDTVKLRLLYAVPPGTRDAKESTAGDDYSDQEDDESYRRPNDMLHQRQPGDGCSGLSTLVRPADRPTTTGSSDRRWRDELHRRVAMPCNSSSDVTKTKANLTAPREGRGPRKDSVMPSLWTNRCSAFRANPPRGVADFKYGYRCQLPAVGDTDS
jgi:hypothetical protein